MTDKIRNICFLGHGGTGKTSLTESILYLTGATDRLGRVADGNTVCDYDAEEIKRMYSISASTAYAQYKGYKVNIIDTPGYFDFAGEVKQATSVADAGIIVCTAKGGIAVGTEKSWAYLEDKKLPKVFYISKLDEENSDFDATYKALRDKFGHTVCPITVPIYENGKVTGVADVILRKAYKMEKNKTVEIPVPDSIADTLEEMHSVLAEAVAETSEEMMEKFFGGEAFTEEEIFTGLKNGVKDASIVPVLCGSGFLGIGTELLLNTAVNLLPSPADRPAQVGTNAGGDEVEILADDNGQTCLFIFKTVSDQYGKFSFFKVLRGKVDADMVLTNSRTGGTEKLGHIFNMQGKKNLEVKTIPCGDIGAVSKLTESKTGDTLCDSKAVVAAQPIGFDAPCYSMAVSPKTKGQEDKIANGLVRLSDEDLTFSIENNAETHQMVLSGAGDIHIDVLCSKLKSKFGVEVELSPVKVPYREKIRKKVKVQGRHKKQSGGHGQFGDVWIEFEPGETEDLTFAENIFGGSVPKQYFPAVEKGLRESMLKGVLAGYPVVYLKATLVDGSYHDVDSSEMAFKMAASIAYKTGLPMASPVILEPIGELKVIVPDNYMGDIIGDLNKRRGRVLGMNPIGAGKQEIEAEVPMAEMGSYAIDLRSMTQSRGSFTFKFARYEEMPASNQAKVIEEAKVNAEAE